jgi:hypothetical protein
VLNADLFFIFSIIPEHIDALLSSWNEFKNYFTVESRPLYLQPSTNSHFHFFIVVELVTSKGGWIIFKSFSVHGWSRSSQWNNDNNSYARCMLYGVALLCRRITPCDRSYVWAAETTLRGIANSTITRKRKWIFLNGRKCKSLISTVMEISTCSKVDQMHHCLCYCNLN